jgi:hypothetical protein
MSDDYKKGYADGFRDGHKAGRDYVESQPPGIWRNNPPGSPAYGCPVCGLSSKDGVMGYVCYHPQCPTRVTCGPNVSRTIG